MPLSITMTAMFTDAAETSTSCPEAACIGQAINITCDIAGVYESIGWSRPDHIEVVTCLRNPDKCYVNIQNYEVVLRSDEKHILRIKNFTTLDSGTWICRDGTDPLRKTCHVTKYGKLKTKTDLVVTNGLRIDTDYSLDTIDQSDN